MGIIVINESAWKLVLKQLKEGGYKASQCISALIETLGYEATVKLVTYQRKIVWLESEGGEE